MRPSGPPSPAGDRHWRGSVRFAAACALAFGTMALLVDWDAHTLTPTRTLLWLTLAATVFAVLLPQRITAGPGWLTARGPLTSRTVHTDALVAVRQYGDVSSHLILRDAYGHRLELDPRVLIANPSSGTNSTPASGAPSNAARCAGTPRTPTSCAGSGTASTTRPRRRYSRLRGFPEEVGPTPRPPPPLPALS